MCSPELTWGSKTHPQGKVNDSRGYITQDNSVENVADISDMYGDMLVGIKKIGVKIVQKAKCSKAGVGPSGNLSGLGQDPRWWTQSSGWLTFSFSRNTDGL